MRITREESKMLGRRQERPVKADGDLLAIFVAGRLRNPNNTRQGWRAVWGYSKKWKERTALAIYEAVVPGARDYGVRAPKSVTFLAKTHNAMDGDGLQAALKPVRDALVECGVISGDADRDGHSFSYEQRIDRKRRGVEIHVRLLDPYLTSDYAGGQGSDFGPPASTPGR